MNVQENIKDEKSSEEYYAKFGRESMEFLSAYIFAIFFILMYANEVYLQSKPK